jgi:DHA1 family tetracycline resistance protein-like MFS transporter
MHLPKLPAHAFIFVTLVFDTMAIGIASPVLPNLVEQLTGGDAAHVAEVFGVFGTLFFIAQFFAAPVQGALADAHGRRPVILISCFGMAADFVLMALAPTIGWLYVGRAISGIATGNIAAVVAYLIDVTPAEDRVRMFSFAGAAANIGTALGPLIGGVAGTYNLRAPFWIAVGLCLINALYGLFVLPESLKPENRAPFKWRHANPVGAGISVVRDYPVMVRWIASIVLFSVALMGVNSIYTVYTSYRYAWAPAQIGVYLSVLGFWNIAIQGAVVPFFAKRFKDTALLIGGTGMGAVALAACGLAPIGLAYAGFAMVSVIGLTFGNAALNGVLSKQIGPSDQARVQGALRSVNSIVGLIAPGLYALMLANSIRLGGPMTSGIPYLASGVLMAISTLVILPYVRPKPAPAP